MRQSKEAVAAAAYRTGGKHPSPPSHLSEQAKTLWNDIVQSRAIDFFPSGTQELLAQFCELSISMRGLQQELAVMREPDSGLINNVTKLSAALTTLGTKLRLTVQSASRIGEAKADEKGFGNSSLLGGYAVEVR